MILELVAIWAIVIAAVVWFVRDERRERADADLKRAASYYAHAPKYRYASPQPEADVPVPARRAGGLTDDQRKFLAALASPKMPA